LVTKICGKLYDSNLSQINIFIDYLGFLSFFEYSQFSLISIKKYKNNNDFYTLININSIKNSFEPRNKIKQNIFEISFLYKMKNKYSKEYKIN